MAVRSGLWRVGWCNTSKSGVCSAVVLSDQEEVSGECTGSTNLVK